MTDMIAECKAVLKTTPARWNQLVETFSEEQLRRKPAPGEWSALEVLVHLIEMERSIFPVRVKSILAEQDFPAFFPDEDGAQLADDASAKALAQEFESLRNENLPLLDDITSNDLNKTANHSELGTVSLTNLLGEWGGHDLMHMVQTNQALMRPFIDNSGPWYPYFEEHDVREGKSQPGR